MDTQAVMQRIFWRFWWASPRERFCRPGVYVWLWRKNRRMVPWRSKNRELRTIHPIDPGPCPDGYRLVIFAKDQPQYRPLPALRAMASDGRVVTRWRPTLGERIQVLVGADVWLQQLTFGHPLQAILPTIGRPAVLSEKPATTKAG